MTINKQQQYRGKIVSWNDEKAFGFIQIENTNRNIFFHINEFYYSEKRPKENYRVVFNIQQTDSKIAAVHVTLAGSAPYTHVNVYAQKNSTRKTSTSAIRHSGENSSRHSGENSSRHRSVNSKRNSELSSTKRVSQTRNKSESAKISSLFVYLLLSCALIYLCVYYPFIFIWIVTLSVLNFFRYRYDKAMAQSGGWRTSEGSLHLIDLLGGWLGGRLAQKKFHHKISKESFMLGFWLTVIMNIVAIMVYIMHTKQVIHIPLIDVIMDSLPVVFQ